MKQPPAIYSRVVLSKTRADETCHSPEDQAILEAAFQLCPKPDKAARMALVDRVALGEKEVQVCSTINMATDGD